MSTSLLPLPLLELTFTRIAARLNARTFLSPRLSRSMSTAATALRQPDLTAYADDAEVVSQSFIRRRRHLGRVGVLTTRTGNKKVSELAQRVQALQETVVSEESFLDLPSFSETELLTIYEDLLAIPPSTDDMTLDSRRNPTLQEPISQVLDTYAQHGDVQKTDDLIANGLNGLPTGRQRDLHIKAHIKATPANTIPTSALAVLHAYEAKGIPAPIPAYTRVITALFSARSSLAYAQAWDLFSHMRYVAHPQPDALLYTLMIRACASSPTASSEPERALDLWTEMTVDHGIVPTTGTYNAIILACARSGEKEYVNEAFRLAKEMLDTHRDAEGNSRFRPDGKTLLGLLEGAKRVGDLARTRWVLAEMVRANVVGVGLEEENELASMKVNEEVMMHVFHAYAAYKPPFKRSAVVLLDEKSHPVRSPPNSSTASDQSNTAAEIESNTALPVKDAEPRFSHIPPQSRSEVIDEAKALFTHIIEDTSARQTETRPYRTYRPSGTRFKDVRLTSRLLNSYLSVYYAHSSLQVAQDLFNTLFGQMGVTRNARSFVEALERCARTPRGTERQLALSFSRNLWDEWCTLENRWRTRENDSCGVDARMIERAYTAMIRVLSLNGNVEQGLDLVRLFFQRYTPSSVRKPAIKPDMRSTRTVLVGARPLVRMLSSVEVPDDTVPPLLTFIDLEILHHRLVATGKREAVGYLKYVCKAYEGALRLRREGTIKAKPVKMGDTS